MENFLTGFVNRGAGAELQDAARICRDDSLRFRAAGAIHLGGK